jgi:hypothetical protein
MTTTTFRPPLNAGIPRHGPTTKPHVAGATRGASPIIRPVALDRGNLLRIRNGRGTRVRVASGVLWVTEENSPEDHVLLSGDAIDLVQPGTAIVLAHQVSHVVLEVPVGVTPPRAVEMAMADGKPDMRIALANPTPMSPLTIATGMATAIEAGLASIRRMVTTLRAHWDAADASTAKTYAPITHCDGFPRRHLGRRMTRGPREV